MQNQIPPGWQKVKLGKNAFLNPKVSLKMGKEYSFIPMEDLGWNKKYAFGDKLKEFKGGAKFEEGDILFARITPCLENGKIGIAKNLSEKKGFGSTEYFVIRGKKNITNTHFLYYLCRTHDLRQVAINSMLGASGRQRASLNSLYNFEFHLPNLVTQQKIASVLSAFDDKIEVLRKQNETLEAIAQTIFKEWFVKFNFPDENGKPYRDRGGNMIDSKLGRIPEGWRFGGLLENNISKLIKTNIDKFEGEKDYVETANVNNSNYTSNFEKVTFMNRPGRANMQPVPNSFWFARMSESRKYLLFQECDQFDIETKILSTGFIGIKSIKEYLYFYWCFISSHEFNNLKNQYAEGAVQIAINNEGIKQIQLPIPRIEVAKKFTKVVEPNFKKISNNNYQIQTLSALRDALLPKLMRGETKV